MNTRTSFTYAFDAYCGWCYGFSPALREFAAQNADRIDLKVLSGGLFSGPRAQPIEAYPHIPGANERIAELTGVAFGDDYQRVLEDGTRVMDSTDAATGLVALRKQAPDRELELASALQSAWYMDGADLSDVETYRTIATDLGLDADATEAAYRDPASREEAEREFRELRALGIDSYPTLLLHSDQGVHRFGGPTTSAAVLTQALDQYLAAIGKA
ncbi:DsbA family protein [Gulosibacter molinativorax]|uniref:DsbA family protein n=1 Tax=Gulosibacter molinativorax TaxID=256821 RepID=A0ABT7C6B6_9MICO|nr:DsbA family protein [Gulosibacter molinativorax]MDJ1370728.1 DsbA family protein [Gulosibacter molinativorax]